MEGEDGLKTLECLRGRLLAERGASRDANEEAKQMGNKLIELENQLRKEVKSRNRAEKRLKSLIKKLKSMNISYVFVVSDESSSEQSSSFEKSEFSSISSSSTASYSSSYPKPPKDDKERPPINTQIRNFTSCEMEEPVKEKEFPSSEISKHNLTNTIRESHIVPSSGKRESDKPISEKSIDSQYTPNINEPARDDHGSKSSVEDKEINGKNYQDWDEGYVDNSMALVPVDIPATAQTANINPAIDNASVKDVLDTLRHVKERLQISMERRHD